MFSIGKQGKKKTSSIRTTITVKPSAQGLLLILTMTQSARPTMDLTKFQWRWAKSHIVHLLPMTCLQMFSDHSFLLLSNIMRLLYKEKAIAQRYRKKHLQDHAMMSCSSSIIPSLGIRHKCSLLLLLLHTIIVKCKLMHTISIHQWSINRGLPCDYHRCSRFSIIIRLWMDILSMSNQRKYTASNHSLLK